MLLDPLMWYHLVAFKDMSRLILIMVCFMLNYHDKFSFRNVYLSLNNYVLLISNKLFLSYSILNVWWKSLKVHWEVFVQLFLGYRSEIKLYEHFLKIFRFDFIISYIMAILVRLRHISLDTLYIVATSNNNHQHYQKIQWMF